MNPQNNDFENENKTKNDNGYIVPSRNNKNDAEMTSETSVEKKSKALKVFCMIGIAIISVLIIIAIVLGILIFKGRQSAVADNKDAAQNIQVPSSIETVSSDTDIETDCIIYDGKKYKYNDKVTSILFAGIDKRNYEHIEGVFGTAGQADCVFVMALNTETGEYKLMAVSRDTMVDVNVTDADGNFVGTEEMQLCLAYAYGDGKEESCDNLKRSVSRIFFGVPMNSYVSVDLDVVSILTEQVGGVSVNVIEDLSSRDPALVEGADITLNGTQAEIFVRARDIYGDENQNNLRMERQKVFLTSFIKKTLQMTKEDIITPLTMYNSITDYMVTDIDASMITYYTSIFLKSGFSADENLIKVPGTTVGGEKYAEYYTDTDEFFKIILDTYYTEIE